MNVELLRITPNALEFIGECAGICYDAPSEPTKNVKRALKCKQDGHLATLRFAHAVFKISGMSRAGSEQALRHKFLDFLKRSQRYCDDGDALVVVPPTIASIPEALEDYLAHAKASSALYKKFRSLGIPKEDARYALLLGTETEFVVVGSLQAWHDFLHGNAGRLQRAAQWEIRKVAVTINNILAEECKGLFNWIPTGE